MQNSAAFAVWNIPFWPTLALLLTAAIYLRGFNAIRTTRPELFPPWRAFCFLSGLATLFLAIASPLDSLSNLLLTAHMTQHLLLMSVAPPLVALGAPLVPLLRGLPRLWIREGLGPFFSLAPVHSLQHLLKSRLFAWVAMNLSFLAWHVPAAYDLALAHPQLHQVEHACFFFTSLLFWWPIVEPWPTVYPGSRWLLLPYLMSADIVNTALSAFLSFAGRIVYPAYNDAPRIFGISALSDQVAAGSLMWVLGSTAFLFPIMLITVRQLSRRGERRAAARLWATAQAAEATARSQAESWTGIRSQTETGTAPSSLRLAPSGQRATPALAPAREAPRGTDGFDGFDIFAVAGLGTFFHSRYGRQSLQAVMLLVALAIMLHGFFGHPMAAVNLAGVLPWTYARALFVLALLFAGNLFCLGCPFMLPREAAKKLAHALGLARLPWPRALRNKWLAATLLALFFWASEALGLWNSPYRTASIVAAYFVAALTIDSIFRGASFCKYVCPVGQFNFVSSLVSPVTLAARSQATCSGCSTRNCIAGTPGTTPPHAAQRMPAVAAQRGCELDLFMPLKSGNLDCTLCMDCVKACPHDNIGLYLQPPALELVKLTLSDPQRSSVGRYSRRPDLAALALIVTSAAFGSAAVMVTPVATLLDRVAAALPAWAGTLGGFLVAAAVPALVFALLLLAILAMRPGLTDPSFATYDPGRGLTAHLCRWTLALLPLGLGMWAAHLTFHLATAAGALLPALAQASVDLHAAAHGQANAGMAAMSGLSATTQLAPGAILQMQLLLLDAGLLLALYVGWRMVHGAGSRLNAKDPAQAASHRTVPERPASPTHELPGIARSLATLAPWATVVLLLYAAGVWVLLEPMQMRGMMGM